MGFFLDKKIWDKDEWNIYLNNLNILRLKHGLRKKDFNKRIGVSNPFRADTNRPSRGTILSICKAFEITANWLCEPHEKASSAPRQISKQADVWGRFGGFTQAYIPGSAGGEEDEGYYRAVREIFQSDNEAMIQALKANIKQFREQIADKQRIKDLEHQIKNLVKEVRRLKTPEGGSADPVDKVEGQ